MRTEQRFRHAVQQRLDTAIHRARLLVAARDDVLDSFDHLVRHVRARSDILRPVVPRDDRTLFTTALLALALNHKVWLRAVETWLPPLAPHRLQFTSLTSHLLAVYAVPSFLERVWFDAPVGEVLPQHGWYIHIATGGSIRTAGFPLPLTRSAAHCLPEVPHHLTVPAGLRWAQVRGAGGSVELAGALASGRLASDLTDAAFWESAVCFLARHEDLDLALVEPIVEYLRVQRSADATFSTKGRTLASILRGIAANGETTRRSPRRPVISWMRSPFHEVRFTDSSERTWSFNELCTSEELIEEGKAMRHCVATYVPRCRRRLTSIWSLSVENLHGRFRVATIEVDLHRRAVVQARGKCDRWIQGVALEIVQRWAAEEGLQMAGKYRGAGIDQQVFGGRAGPGGRT